MRRMRRRVLIDKTSNIIDALNDRLRASSTGITAVASMRCCRRDEFPGCHSGGSDKEGKGSQALFEILAWLEARDETG